LSKLRGAGDRSLYSAGHMRSLTHFHVFLRDTLLILAVADLDVVDVDSCLLFSFILT